MTRRSNPVPRCDLALFLGGHDLEMVTIGELGRRWLGPERVYDKGLRWGAKASAYGLEIVAAQGAGLKVVLVELENDIGSSLEHAAIDRARVVLVDHHGAQAGADKPSALRQVFDLIGCPKRVWTRRFRLVDANDIGHMAGLRAVGTSAAEIRRIRDEDRRAQGVAPEDEVLAARALAGARSVGGVLVIESETARTSPILDRLEPEYGGPGAGNVLVVTPESVEFYGSGAVIERLVSAEGGWSGGALPKRGFWGKMAAAPDARHALANRALALSTG